MSSSASKEKIFDPLTLPALRWLCASLLYCIFSALRSLDEDGGMGSGEDGRLDEDGIFSSLRLLDEDGGMAGTHCAVGTTSAATAAGLPEDRPPTRDALAGESCGRCLLLCAWRCSLCTVSSAACFCRDRGRCFSSLLRFSFLDLNTSIFCRNSTRCCLSFACCSKTTFMPLSTAFCMSC